MHCSPPRPPNLFDFFICLLFTSKASLETEVQQQQTCSALDKPEEALAERENRAGIKVAEEAVDAEAGKRRDERGHKAPASSAATSRTSDGGSPRSTDAPSRDDETTRTQDGPQRGDRPTTEPTTSGKKHPGGGVSSKKRAGSKSGDAGETAVGPSSAPEENVSIASAGSSTRRPKTSQKVPPGSGGDGTRSAAERKRASSVKTATGRKGAGIKAHGESSSNMKSDGAQTSSSLTKRGVTRAGGGARQAASSAAAEGAAMGVGHSSKVNKRGAGGASSAASKTRKHTSAAAGKTPSVDRSRGSE